MTCICGHDAHAWDEPTVCKTLSCKCEKFVQATPENVVIQEWDIYVEQMKHVSDQVRWVLENLKYTRNLENKQFVDFFRSKISDADPETVRRTKQKLVETNKPVYGPFDAPELENQKAFKQLGIEEWVCA